MEFNIFKWWESWIKPIVYFIVIIITGLLITGYFFVNDDGGEKSFIISILYACILFFIIIPINKINSYIAEKIYEREIFYLSLKKLRDVTNSTIKRANYKDFKELRNIVISFQVFTGRSENMIEAQAKGERVHVYVKEKGFIYSSDMLQLERNFLDLCDNNKNEKKLIKSAKKLCKCYAKSCKKLEHNYNKIARLYGGALFELIERDNTASDTIYSLDDIISKIDDTIIEFNNLKCELDNLTNTLNNNQEDMLRQITQLTEYLKDIENFLCTCTDEMLE